MYDQSTHTPFHLVNCSALCLVATRWQTSIFSCACLITTFVLCTVIQIALVEDTVVIWIWWLIYQADRKRERKQRDKRTEVHTVKLLRQNSWPNLKWAVSAVFLKTGCQQITTEFELLQDRLKPFVSSTGFPLFHQLCLLRQWFWMSFPRFCDIPTKEQVVSFDVWSVVSRTTPCLKRSFMCRSLSCVQCNNTDENARRNSLIARDPPKPKPWETRWSLGQDETLKQICVWTPMQFCPNRKPVFQFSAQLITSLLHQENSDFLWKLTSWLENSATKTFERKVQCSCFAWLVWSFLTLCHSRKYIEENQICSSSFAI